MTTDKLEQQLEFIRLSIRNIEIMNQGEEKHNEEEQQKKSVLFEIERTIEDEISLVRLIELKAIIEGLIERRQNSNGEVK